MVHALEEAIRALAQDGQLIDLRPLSVDSRLEILSGEAVHPAGVIDFSPGLPEDMAADKAVATLVRRDDLVPDGSRQFEHAYYWDDLPSMKAYVEDRWSDSAVIPKRVFKKAEELIRKSPQPTRIRVRLVVSLATYRKGSRSRWVEEWRGQRAKVNTPGGQLPSHD